ncbi:MAG: hypothetical protein AAF387_10660 [Pseudomonadota bacterium]
MTSSKNNASFVTAVLPTSTAGDTIQALTEDQNANAMITKARGTLLQDHWWRAWVPPISPAKTKLQLLVPDQDLDRVLKLIVEHGKLHLQASGAVFSHQADNLYLGSEFRLLSSETVSNPAQNQHAMKSNLRAIFCTSSHADSDKLAKAAINAGAHGPIVYYCEGHGLRDRLGWLRITKEAEQEVLLIVADSDESDVVFDAVARAGEMHLPGRGFMYQIDLNQGMFNLPSHLSNQRFDANMQQIINAIDHLSGHTHWRDNADFNPNQGSQTNIALNQALENAITLDQVCITAMVDRDHSQQAMDLMLDAGAPGVTSSFASLLTHEETSQFANAQVNQEYAVMNSIVNQATASKVKQYIEQEAENAGLRDLCAFTVAVPKEVHYKPGKTDHRARPQRTTVAPAQHASSSA